MSEAWLGKAGERSGDTQEHRPGPLATLAVLLERTGLASIGEASEVVEAFRASAVDLGVALVFVASNATHQECSRPGVGSVILRYLQALKVQGLVCIEGSQSAEPKWWDELPMDLPACWVDTSARKVPSIVQEGLTLRESQPWERVARTALLKLLERVAGRAGLELPSVVVPSSQAGAVDLSTLTARLQRSSQLIAGALAAVPDTGIPRDLSEALREEVSGNAGAFGRAFGVALDREPSVVDWQRLLRALCLVWSRASELPLDLWLACESLRSQRLRAREIEVTARLLAARDREGVQRALEQVLGVLAIHDARFATVQPPTSPCFELLLSLAGGVVSHGPVDGSTSPDLAPSSRVLVPLLGRDHCYGVADFKLPCSLSAAEALSLQVGLALEGVAQHQALLQQRLHELQRDQERLATQHRLQAVGGLAASVAHHLNNALAPLVVLPDIILADLARVVSNTELGTVSSDLVSVRSSAMQAAVIIQELLTLGRQVQVQKSPVRLSRVLLAGTTAIVDASPDRRARVSLHEQTEALTVMACEHQLTRAVSQLVSSALQAAGDKGQVEIFSRRELLAEPRAGFEVVPPGNYAVVQVVDSGPGILPDSLPLLFDPCFPGDPTIEEAGTRLGLCVVYAVVKMHDGFLDVESTAGAGCSIELFLPLSGEKPNLLRPAAEMSGEPAESTPAPSVPRKKLELAGRPPAA